MAELIPPGSDTPIMSVPHAFDQASEGETSTQVIVNPHPFSVVVKPLKVKAGMTVLEIVAAAGVAPVYNDFITVFVDDYMVPRDQWAFVRPRVGRFVYIRTTPQKGSGDMLRSLLTLVVVVASAYFAPILAAGMGLAVGGVGQALIGAGLSLVGALAAAALFPPPAQNGKLPSQRTLLTGVRNQFAPYAFIPRHFGKRRAYPLLAARPYTEAQGKDRYLRALLAVGYGPLTISEIKIGDTDIANYSAMKVQTRDGWAAGHDAFGKRCLTEDANLRVGVDPHTLLNATEATVDGRPRFTSTVGNPGIRFDLPVALVGASNRWLRARFRRISASGSTWRGAVSWKTGGHGYDAATYRADVPGVVSDDRQWIIIEWDMQNAAAGAADWNSSTITGVQMSLFTLAGTVFEIDWVKIGGLRADDTDQTLFTNLVGEETFNITLDDAGPGAWVQRTTEPETSEISIDITFPSGLAEFKDSGGTKKVTITADVQYRLVGSGTWIPVVWDGNDTEDGTQTDGVLTCRDSTASATVRGGRWLTGAPGQYEVQIRRVTAKLTPEARNAQTMQWTALRSIKEQNPINMDGLSLIALRMKATDQLSGMPDTINCVVQAYLPQDYGQGWIWEETASPAWAYVDTMRRRGVDRQVADERIDTARIQSWASAAAMTAANADEEMWTFNGTTEGGSVWQTLKLIAGHSRANFSLRDGKYSAVFDTLQTVPTQHITPRNSFGYSGNRAFIDQPDCLKVQYINAANGYQEDEVLVYADGFNATNAVKFESISMPGCTSATEAWRAGRYFLAVGRLRPDEHQVTMDIEYLRCGQGDYVLLSHDVLSVGLAAARITSLLPSGANTIGYVLDQSVVREVGTSYGLRVRKSDGASVLLALAAKTGTADLSYQVDLATPVVTAGGPAVGDLVIYGEYGLETAPMLVKKIEPGSQLTAKLTLVDAQPGVWTADTGDIPAFQTFVTDQTPIDQKRPAVPVFSLQSDETVIVRLGDGTLQDRIAVTLEVIASSKSGVATWEAQYRQTEAVNWLGLPPASVSIKQIYIAPVIQNELYDVRVRAISQYGVTSDWAVTSAHLVIGQTTPPADVLGLAAEPHNDGVQLSWTANPEIDIAGYQIRKGTNWETADEIQKKYQGTSLFVGLTARVTTTFLVRAVDKMGLTSLGAASVAAAVVPPADVETFTAYMQTDHMRFKWTKVEGLDMLYEIRCGTDWPTSRRVVRTPGSSVTVKWPTRDAGTTTFWIKAFSVAGLYSVTARFFTVVVEPKNDLNIILDTDFSASTWAGNAVNWSIIGSGASSYLQVTKDYDGLSFGSADFYRTISLSNEYRARCWIETLMTLSVGLQTWNSRKTWDEASELTWIGTIVDEQTAEITPYIAEADATWTPPNIIEAFSLNSTTTGTLGTTPSSATTVYGPMGAVNGLLTMQSDVTYNTLSLPAAFTTIFDFVFDWGYPNWALMIMGVPADPETAGSPSDQSYGNFGLLQFNAGANFLRVGYNSSLDQIQLISSLRPVIGLASDLIKGDRLTFAVSQSATNVTLMMYNSRTGVVSTITDASGASIGTVTLMKTSAGALQNAPGTMGNIELRTGVLSLVDFTALAPVRPPVGYRPFRELVPADYKFQDAVIWLHAEILDTSLNINLIEANMFVDVPDLPQSATETLSGAAITVTFAKAYTVVPVVQATAVSGAVMPVPKVTGVSTTGFTLDLRSVAAPGTSVAGTVNWTAKGY